MRHRLTCPLYDQHPKHLDLLNHLDQFAGGDRGRELATLAVAGFAALYGGGNSVPQSLEGDLGDLLRQFLKSGAAQQPSVTQPTPAPQPAPAPAVASRPEPPAKSAQNKSVPEPAQSSPVKPPQEPAPPAKSDLLDQAPVPEEEDDDDDQHMDSLAMIGRKFG